MYRFFDGQGRLLYIGATSCFPRRLREHARDKPWWDDVARIDIEHFSSLKAAQTAEVEAIKSEKPLYNKIAASVGLSEREREPKRRLLRARGLGSCAVDFQKDLWCWRIRATGEKVEGYLRLYWEVDGDPITDGFRPEEVSAFDLWQEWARNLADPERVRIHWFVICPEEGVFEVAPFSVRAPSVEEDFLTFFTWPWRESIGELLKWTKLPVVDKRWVPGNGDKGGFIQEATGWKPAPFQETVNVLSLAKAARLPMPSRGALPAEVLTSGRQCCI